MSTSIAARVVRPRLSYDSFAHLTSVPVAVDGITSDGILFDGDLTLAEVDDVWWFATSRDAADETARRNLAAMRDTQDPGLCAALVTYLLGDTA